MSKHTPGPWEIDWYICREGNKELWRVPRAIGPAYVDHNHWAGNYITVDEADARLIAAAPDLLEAAKQVAAWHEAEDDHSKADFYERIEMCRKSEAAIRAAIAKAEGA